MALAMFGCMANAQTEVLELTVKKMVQVTVKNSSNLAKANEPVVVKLADIKGMSFTPEHALVKDGDEMVRCQLDDMDGDLRADELFFLTDLKPKESKTFSVELAISPTSAMTEAEKAEPRIYTALQIRDKKDLHPDVRCIEAPATSNIFNDVYMHGMTIESELCGYRIYFDHRQNIDLYGKKYRRIELPETQFYTTADQIAKGYGVDVLWAGQAIGCGSFKNWTGSNPDNWTNLKVRGQRVVTSGPLRTVVELYDLGINYTKDVKPGYKDQYDIRQYYTMYAGHRDLKVDIVFSKQVKDQFCTGVQKVGVTAEDSVRRGHKPEGILRADGIVASWGCDYPDMGKKQLWGPEAIGMAVYMPKEYIKDSKEDELNYVYVVEPKDAAIHYYLSFCADKEEQGYHTAKEWFASLDQWKQNITSPVQVTIK